MTATLSSTWAAIGGPFTPDGRWKPTACTFTPPPPSPGSPGRPPRRRTCTLPEPGDPLTRTVDLGAGRRRGPPGHRGWPPRRRRRLGARTARSPPTRRCALPCPGSSPPVTASPLTTGCLAQAAASGPKVLCSQISLTRTASLLCLMQTCTRAYQLHEDVRLSQLLDRGRLSPPDRPRAQLSTPGPSCRPSVSLRRASGSRSYRPSW